MHLTLTLVNFHLNLVFFGHHFSLRLNIIRIVILLHMLQIYDYGGLSEWLCILFFGK